MQIIVFSQLNPLQIYFQQVSGRLLKQTTIFMLFLTQWENIFVLPSFVTTEKFKAT